MSTKASSCIHPSGHTDILNENTSPVRLFTKEWEPSAKGAEYESQRASVKTSALMIEGLTLEIIAEASRQSAASSNHTCSWLEHARDILHERFSDNITLTCLAKLVRVHPVYLASSLRKRYHCTIGGYRQRLRIEFACNELTKSHSSLAQIALAAGFANQAHFSKTFKRLTGTTPAKVSSRLSSSLRTLPFRLRIKREFDLLRIQLGVLRNCS